MDFSIVCRGHPPINGEASADYVTALQLRFATCEVFGPTRITKLGLHTLIDAEDLAAGAPDGTLTPRERAIEAGKTSQDPDADLQVTRMKRALREAQAALSTGA